MNDVSGVIVNEQGRLIILFQMDQMIPDLLPFFSDHAGLAVGGIFSRSWLNRPFQYVSKLMWIECLYPVGDPVRPACKMTVRLKAELPRIRRQYLNACADIPGSDNFPVSGSGWNPAERDLRPRQLILRRMVDIRTQPGQAFRRFIMADIRLHAVRITVLRDIRAEFFHSKSRLWVIN